VLARRRGRQALAQRVISNGVKRKKRESNPLAFQKQSKAFQSGLHELSSRKEGEPCFRLREELKALMIDQVGIFRRESDLLSAKEKIRELKERFGRIGLKQKRLAFNNEWIQYLELEGMLHVAEVITEGALARKESRGFHFRTD
jgi:succinate dehydrogenase/fumarate reductase flavoprotein subunit